LIGPDNQEVLVTRTIVVLRGDQTGEELLNEALLVLEPAVIGLDLEFIDFDLSLESRRATQNQVVYDSAVAMRQHGLGLKAATITPPEKGDVGSPNRILREEIGAEVILRTGRRIPGVRPIAGVYSPISVVRMAIEGAYGAKEWREGEEGSQDEVAYRTEKISRRVCRAVAEYSFQHARYTRARVFGGPKFTVSQSMKGFSRKN
jgi:isocitrate/isopropylmalate dehydrogenase